MYILNTIILPLVLGVQPPSFERYAGVILGTIMIAILVGTISFVAKFIGRTLFGVNHAVGCPECEADFFFNTKSRVPVCPRCNHRFSLEEGQRKIMLMALKEIAEESQNS